MDLCLSSRTTRVRLLPEIAPCSLTKLPLEIKRDSCPMWWQSGIALIRLRGEGLAGTVPGGRPGLATPVPRCDLGLPRASHRCSMHVACRLFLGLSMLRQLLEGRRACTLRAVLSPPRLGPGPLASQSRHACYTSGLSWEAPWGPVPLES